MRTKPLAPAATALRTPGPAAAAVSCRDTVVEAMVVAVNCRDMAVEAMVAAVNGSDMAVEAMVVAVNGSDTAVAAMVAAVNCRDTAAREGVEMAAEAGTRSELERAAEVVAGIGRCMVAMVEVAMVEVAARCR